MRLIIWWEDLTHVNSTVVTDQYTYRIYLQRFQRQQHGTRRKTQDLPFR